MAINEKDLLQRIDSLEKRIEKLEKALSGGAKPKSDQVDDDYEQIIKRKETSAAYYFLTNKGRVIQHNYNITNSAWNYVERYDDARYTDETKSKLKPEWLEKFKENLLFIGEKDLLKGDSEEAVIECAAALRAKYRATPGLPCLLPNMSTVSENGHMSKFKETTKAIKFK